MSSFYSLFIKTIFKKDTTVFILFIMKSCPLNPEPLRMWGHEQGHSRGCTHKQSTVTALSLLCTNLEHCGASCLCLQRDAPLQAKKLSSTPMSLGCVAFDGYLVFRAWLVVAEAALCWWLCPNSRITAVSCGAELVSAGECHVGHTRWAVRGNTFVWRPGLGEQRCSHVGFRYNGAYILLSSGGCSSRIPSGLEWWPCTSVDPRDG